jgi:hypothetical protein
MCRLATEEIETLDEDLLRQAYGVFFQDGVTFKVGKRSYSTSATQYAPPDVAEEPLFARATAPPASKLRALSTIKDGDEDDRDAGGDAEAQSLIKRASLGSLGSAAAAGRQRVVQAFAARLAKMLGNDTELVAQALMDEELVHLLRTDAEEAL